MLEGVQSHFVGNVTEEALDIALGKFEKPVRPAPSSSRKDEAAARPGPAETPACEPCTIARPIRRQPNTKGPGTPSPRAFPLR